MNIFLIAAFVFAALEALALWKNWNRLEYIAKPAVMVALFIWLFISVGLNGAPLWFGLGILFSLAGDIFLMDPPDRFFLAGLIAFLFAHIAYAVGFNTPLPEASSWGFILAAMIGLGGSRITRRIVDSLPARGQSRMKIPIMIYSLAISVMLLSAMLKIMDASWSANAAALVSIGAFLFYLSDIILAWNKFVAPVTHGRIYNIAAYHLGQIALIAGAVAQFSK